jgi:hypothetical protein
VKLPKSFLTVNLSEKHAWEGTVGDGGDSGQGEGSAREEGTAAGLGPEGGPLGEVRTDGGVGLDEVRRMEEEQSQTVEKVTKSEGLMGKPDVV